MPRRRARTNRHPTGIVLAIMLVVAVVAVVALVGLGGGGDDEGERATSGPDATTSTRGTSTTTTTVRGPVEHTVQAGDILTPLANFYGVSTAAIMKANPDLNPDRLVVGQVLKIPSPIPLSLKITPRKTIVGASIELELEGAREAETIVFEIQRPTTPFVGQPHTATTEGEVSASYELGLADPPGEYTVIARGNLGTLAQATFVVEKDSKR